MLGNHQYGYFSTNVFIPSHRSFLCGCSPILSHVWDSLNPFAQSLGVLFGIAFMAASDIELKPQPKDDKANQND